MSKAKETIVDIDIALDVRNRIETLSFNLGISPREIIRQAITNYEKEYTEGKKKRSVRVVSDKYYELYSKKFGGKPGWGGRETKRVKELFKRYNNDSQLIVDTLEFMFNTHDELWTSHLGVFTSLTGFALIDRAVAKMREYIKSLEPEVEKYPDTGEIKL